MQKNKELELAWNFVQYTDRTIFLTGNAGTGKTTFLRNLKQNSSKRIVITAPTGVAAINAGGVTIHSFFQLPFGPILTEKVTGKKQNSQEPQYKFNKKKINIIKTMDLLVIDEISMVRADMLDAIDEVLRKYRNRLKPFGGVQLLMIGDLEQLAPVIKNEEWNLLKSYYPSIYFFNSKAAIESNFITIELKHIYRQEDEKFIKILNEVRESKLSSQSIIELNQRYIKGFEPTEQDEYIMLTTHNSTADQINLKRLKNLSGKEYAFSATVSGIFSEYSYPTDFNLKLKINAQVMFVKNDSSYEKRYFNGKIGKIIDINEENEIIVQCENDENFISVTPETWENIKYDINETTGEIKEEVIGSYSQYPLRLAWAITIHKSQGLTFEKAIIDAEAAFAHGQTYVALSRCKTLEGLILSSQISDSSLISDEKVSDFNEKIKENPPSENDLNESKYRYQLDLISELFNYRQLRYWIERIEKTISENQKIIFGQLKDQIEPILKTNLPEITSISTKFIAQVNQLLQNERDIEKNTMLNERIKKAAEYFLEYHKIKIVDPIMNSYETDNKEVKKTIEEQIDQILEIINIKQSMLKSCLNGFNIHEINRAKTTGTLNGEIKKKSNRKELTITSLHPELYEQLSYWRKETARNLNIAPNQILLQKTMIDISNAIPLTLANLRKVSGVGKVKVRDYGLEIVSLVAEYLESKGLRNKLNTVETRIKERSEDITWKLYKSGLSLEEIAKERNCSINTVETHISKCIDKPDFNFQEFVTKEKIEIILDYYHDNPDSELLTEAKAKLGDKVNWFELRLVNAIRKKIMEEESEIE